MAINLSPLHVLIVEDINPLRELVMSILKTQGVGTVTFAANGRQGYDRFKREHPDVIITDWNMPEGGGLEMVKRIRTDTSSHDRTVPIILTTGFCSAQKITQARDNGVTEFLIKPFSAKEMSRRIHYAIRNPRDFVVADTYCGPDRRRMNAQQSQFDEKQSRRTPKGTAHQIIKPNNTLQNKLGIGSVDEDSVARSQRIMEENRFNFLPLALDFFTEFEQEVNRAYTQLRDASNRRIIENIALPIMQIKANARIFKFELLGDIATGLLNFFDGVNLMDDDAWEVVFVHQRTMRHILDEEVRGNGGEIGESFKDELERACIRYTRTRADVMKKKLQPAVAAEA